MFNAILPTASKENEENLEENETNPSSKWRGRSTTKSNILGSNLRLPHTNSPRHSPRRSRSNSKKYNGSNNNKQRTEQNKGRGGRRIRWEDQPTTTSFSPTSLNRNLEEQGIVGVFFDNKGVQRQQRHSQNNNQVDHHGQVYSHDGASQRTGLQRRSSTISESSRESSSSNYIVSSGDGTFSPNRTTTSNRITPSTNYRVKYSAAMKRRMMVLSFGAGLTLVGYFFEIRQIMNNASSQSSYGQQHTSKTEWLMNFPRSFLGGDENTSFGMTGGGGFDNARMEERQGYFSRNNNPVISVEEEWKRVEALSKSRAARRRMRTKPPSTYPTIPAAASFAATGSKAAASNAEPSSMESPPPPRLTLDLPAHRELDNAMVDHSVLQAAAESGAKSTNTHDGIRRRLMQTQTQQQPATPPSTICGSQAFEASQLNPNHYPASAHIGPKSRIVITGALSQVGMELILQLHEQCQVKFIVGIDAAYPNTRHERIDMIESRYNYIQRRVPAFQRLMVPVFGIHPHPKIGEEVRFERMGQGFDLVKKLKPTHIVHLAGMEEGRGEYVDYGDTVDASPFAEGGGDRGMMRRFNSLVSMEQVLSSLARFNADPERVGEQPQLVYISSNEANDQSGVSLKSGAAGGRGDPTPASVYGTSCLLNEILASYFHRNHGVDSVGLRAPTIFGPFSRPGSLLYDLAERTIRNAAGKNGQDVPRYHLDRDRYEFSSIMSKREGAVSGAEEQMAFVYDVSSAIVAAMQFKKDYSSPTIDPNGPTLMQIGSKQTTSMKDVKEMMEGYFLPPNDQSEAAAPSSSLTETPASSYNAVLDTPSLSIYNTERNRNLLGWTHKTTLQEGFKTAIAWQVLKAYPFGLPDIIPSHPTFLSLLEDTRDSLSYHSLPCASGCRWGGSMCSESAWDDAIGTTKELTKSCPYVLYTVDLRPELVHMEKQSAPSQRKGWEAMFCKIAFVSSSSELAQKMYANELKEQTPMNEWNGNGKEGHWHIVVLEGTRYTMPEFERSMAKLTPTNLFNGGVKKAMYVNHRRVILTTDQAMGVMRHLEMDARKKRQKRTIVDEKTKENVDTWLQPHPQRHSVFFTNKYSFDDDFDTSSAKNLASFVMTNAGIAETKDIRAQIQFYEQSAHLTRTSMNRSPNYQELYQDNFFPFDFLRSTWLVHELKSQEGRNLRCEMYEEHSLWGNSEMEDMSMGFVMAKLKAKMNLGKMAQPQYDGPEEWYPLLIPRVPGDEDAVAEGPVYLDYLEPAQKVATDRKGHEFYVSFLPQKSKGVTPQ
ncbi:hypothetical protein ACHAXR_013501 [Thalassiosira sp. AJA248-18]